MVLEEKKSFINDNYQFIDEQKINFINFCLPYTHTIT